jgi:hypothetical protein
VFSSIKDESLLDSKHQLVSTRRTAREPAEILVWPKLLPLVSGTGCASHAFARTVNERINEPPPRDMKTAAWFAANPPDGSHLSSSSVSGRSSGIPTIFPSSSSSAPPNQRRGFGRRNLRERIENCHMGNQLHPQFRVFLPICIRQHDLSNRPYNQNRRTSDSVNSLCRREQISTPLKKVRRKFSSLAPRSILAPCY